TSALGRASQHAVTSLARASAAADMSIAASVDLTTAGAEMVTRAAWQEAHHPPVLNAWRTSSFGLRWGRLHRGIDYGADVGEPLYAVAPGTVSSAGWTYGLGYHVKLTLEDGTVLVYGHLSTVGVSQGEQVAAG